VDPSANLTLRLLGGFSLQNLANEVLLSPAGERLLAFVALRDAAPRHTVAFRLWADHTEEQANSCLRSTLWRLPKPGGVALIRTAGGRLRLDRQLVVDIQVARRQVESWPADDAPPDAIGVESFASDLLPAWYDDWLIIERERHRQLRLHALERLSAWYTARGQFATAIEAGLRAVAGDPLRESAHRCLVRAHLAEGNVSEAVRQTRSYLKLLGEAGLPARLSPHMEELTFASFNWPQLSRSRSSM
jgi:DNA-binding SARP family transcriptional activator